MSSQTAYALIYLEINIVSVIIVLLIRHKTSGISKMVAQNNFVMAIDSLVAFFLSDTLFVMIKLGKFPFSTAAVLGSKSVYFFSTALMCYFWFIYFEFMQDSPFVQSRRSIRISSVLVWVMAVLLVINLFTGILFYVDSDGVYRRGPLFLTQYVLSYIYVFFTSGRAFISIFRKGGNADKKMLISLAMFPLAPAAAGILQFIYPEIPLACATLSIATLILYLDWTEKMIAIDPLTRLNNRKQLVHFYEQWQQDEDDKTVPYLIIADANKFKSINDTYGHIQGDAALVRIASALRLGCGECSKRTNITRYGGDEFVVLVWAQDEEQVKELCGLVSSHAERLNGEAKAPYELTLSYGYAKADKETDIDEVIKTADEMLYEAKRELPDGGR